MSTPDGDPEADQLLSRAKQHIKEAKQLNEELESEKPTSGVQEEIADPDAEDRG